MPGDAVVARHPGRARTALDRPGPDGSRHTHPLAEAIAVALGDHRAGASLSPGERSKLADYNRRIVVPRPQVVGLLDDLQHTLEELLCYQRNKGIQAMKIGRGPAVRTVEPAASSTSHEHELGRELLGGRRQRNAAPTAGGDVLVVAGADHLAAELGDHLTSTTAQAGKHLVLISGKITSKWSACSATAVPVARSSCGCPTTTTPGSPPNTSTGTSRSWSTATRSPMVTPWGGPSRRHVVGRSSSVLGEPSASAALVGKTIAIGRSLGTSVTKSFDSSESYNASVGGSHQHTNTVNTSRVHDYVLEPEKFQTRGRHDAGRRPANSRAAGCDPDISLSPWPHPRRWAPDYNTTFSLIRDA